MASARGSAPAPGAGPPGAGEAADGVEAGELVLSAGLSSTTCGLQPVNAAARTAAANGTRQRDFTGALQE